MILIGSFFAYFTVSIFTPSGLIICNLPVFLAHAAFVLAILPLCVRVRMHIFPASGTEGRRGRGERPDGRRAAEIAYARVKGSSLAFARSPFQSPSSLSFNQTLCTKTA